MILVVTEQLNLSFLLQHQGRVVSSVRSATAALELLRDHGSNIQGVILDDRVPNSRIVRGYINNKRPDLKVTPWNVAQRNSPFKNVAVPGLKAAPRQRAQMRDNAGRRFILYTRAEDEAPR